MHYKYTVKEKKYIIIANILVLLIIIGPLYYTFLRHSYWPETDETWQLQAAYRLANGNGYTCTFNPTKDLSLPGYSYLIAWPPGYSVVIAGFYKIGFTVNTAAIFYKFIVSIIGIYFWSLLLFLYLSSNFTKILFGFILGFLAISYQYSPTDLTLWALFPVLSCILLPIASNQLSSANIIKKLLLGSILISFLISIRYQSLVLLLLILIWLIISNKFPLKKLFLRLLLLFSLPVLTYLTISYFNFTYGSALSIHTAGGINGIAWNNLWILNVVEAIIIHNLFFDKIVNLLFTDTSTVAYHSISIFVSVVVIMFFIWCIRKFCLKNERLFSLIKWYLSGLAASILFLLALTIFFFDKNSIWIPLGEGRFYEFLSPIFWLILLIPLDYYLFNILKNKLNRVIIPLFMVVPIIVMTWVYILSKEEILQTYDDYKTIIIQNISQKKANNQIQNSIAIANNPIINMLLLEDTIPTYRDFASVFNDSSYFSQKTLVVVIDSAESDNVVSSIDNLIKYHDTPIKFNYDSLRIGKYNFYWSLFDKGQHSIK